MAPLLTSTCPLPGKPHRQTFILALAGLLLFGLPAPRAAAEARPLPEPPAGAHFGLCVLDAETGDTVREADARKSFTPASVMKLFTSFAALDRLGPAYATRTRLHRPASGGGLVAVGGGDPLLEAAGLDALALAARRAGASAQPGPLRLAPGRFAPDPPEAGLPYPPGWAVDDLGTDYAAPTGSWILHRNATADEHAVTAPRALAGKALLSALGRAGLKGLSGPLEIGEAALGPEVAGLDSPPLAEWVRVMNLESDNLVAETVLLHLGGPGRVSAARERGLARMRDSLSAAGVPLAGCRFADGSGLSRYALATPEALARVLVAARRNPAVGAPLLASLPQAGLSGTLGSRLSGPGPRGRVRAKTGTMGGVSCLAGYVEQPDGRTQAFALMLNHPASTTAARAYLDAVVQELLDP